MNKRTGTAVASVAAGLAAVLGLHASHPSNSPASGPSSPTTSATVPSSSQPSAPSAPPGASVSAVGTSEQFGYGILSVKATARGHRLVDVTVANLQTAESYSQSLAQQVVPVLRSEVLAAQSANVNAISGATYTSEAYLYSLQSALDKLHL